MKSYKNLLLAFCLKDNDFKGVYNTALKAYPSRLLSFKEELINCLDYAFSENLDIYLDKKYLDISYISFKGKKKIINLDNVYLLFKDMLEDNGAY